MVALLEKGFNYILSLLPYIPVRVFVVLFIWFLSIKAYRLGLQAYSKYLWDTAYMYNSYEVDYVNHSIKTSPRELSYNSPSTGAKETLKVKCTVSSQGWTNKGTVGLVDTYVIDTKEFYINETILLNMFRVKRWYGWQYFISFPRSLPTSFNTQFVGKFMSKARDDFREKVSAKDRYVLKTVFKHIESGILFSGR